MYQIIFNIFKRKELVDTAVDGGNHRKGCLPMFPLLFLLLCLPLLRNMLYRIDTLLNNKVSVYVRIVKNKVLCRIVHHIPVKETILLIELSCTNLTVRNDKPERCITYAKNKVCLLLLNTPCHQNRLTRFT